MTKCRWCKVEIVGNVPNHVRWCNDNPKRQEYLDTLKSTRESVDWPTLNKKKAPSIRKAHADGKYDNKNKNQIGKPGTPHTLETKEHIRQKALASGHRRLVKSCRDYIKKDGTIVKLDSSWEEILAKRLDFLNIVWERPKSIKWIDKNGIRRNYFPDFYLSDFDIFLDPKNPYAIRAQKDKLECLTQQVKNLIIIKTLEECKNYFPPDQYRKSMNNLTKDEMAFISEMQKTTPVFQDWMFVEVEPNWTGPDTVALSGNVDARVFIPSGCTASDDMLFGSFRIRGVH